MKKYSLLFLFLLAFLNSCQDATEIDPKDVLVDDLAIENTTDLELAVRGIYAVMSPQSQIYFTSLVTDEVIVGNTSNGSGLSTHRYNITASDGAASAIWAGQYAIINRVNRILALADANVVAKNAADQIVLDNLKGECYAVRALAHFELFSYYSPSYTNDSDLSVPYIDYVVIFQKPGRNTVGEVAAGINADIALAEEFLPNTIVINRMNRAGLTALKAKFNLFRGNYDAAIAAVNELDATFDLSEPQAYQDMFLVNDSTDGDESLFELTRASSADAAIGRVFINNTPGSTNFNMSNSLFTRLFDLNDIRLSVNIDEARSTIPTDVQIGKYRGSANFNYINSFKYFRLSDMFLIRAEANLRKAGPNLGAAQADLQAILNARDITGTPPTVTVASVADGLTKVLDARRVELAFEASRFTDLKRFGIGVDRTSGGTDCDGTLTPCVLPATDYRFTLPIPEAELLANPTIVPQQNTGY